VSVIGARPVPSIVTEVPGPRAQAQVAFDRKWTSPSLPRAYPFVPVRGEGCTLEDIDGNLYLDFNAGIAVNATGHCHPRLVAAMSRQVTELLHYCGADFFLPQYAQAAAELARIAPMGPCKVFIGNSGTEAVEAAIKLARHHTKRQNVVAFIGAFHGRTYGAVSLSASKAKYHAGYGPLLPGVYHVPFGSAGLDELEGRVFKRFAPAEEFAAIFVEPVQGEGGYVVPDPDFLPRLRHICDRHGILLVADEVQSGAGRTGRMWAIEHWGVEPDILVTAKGIASGMPVGAMVARAERMTWGPGAHGSTYGGNPVALVAMLETIKLLEEGLIANAAERGVQAMAILRPLAERFPAMIRDVRGLGLMLGVQFDSGDTAEAVQLAAFRRGVLVLQAGDDCVRISPPLVITADEMKTGLGLFIEAIEEVAADRVKVLAKVHEAAAMGQLEPTLQTGS
jgi:4-aminobutyrate aminotransferase